MTVPRKSASLGRTLMALGLSAILATPALADLGLILPESPFIDDPDKNAVNLVFCVVDPLTGEGVPLERPQVFTTLRNTGEAPERSEHLSVLEETNAYGARAWAASVALPHPGAYQFIAQTKAIWEPDEDRFIQYITKVQIPAGGSAQGWDTPAGISFEIAPLSRPFGLGSGMAFTGQALSDAAPLPGILIDAVRLDPSIKPNITPPDKLQPADPAAKPEPEKKKTPPAALPPFRAYQQIKADSQGVFTFVCPTPGWWAFSATRPGDPLQDPEGKLKPLEVKTIFWVYIDDYSKAPRTQGKSKRNECRP